MLMGEAKEWADTGRGMLGLYGNREKYSYSEMREDAAGDRAVNFYGATTPSNMACNVRCERYIFQLQPDYPKSAGLIRGIYGP